MIHNPPASVLPHDYHPFHSVCRKDMQCGESLTGGFFMLILAEILLLMTRRMTASCGQCFPYETTVRQVLCRNGVSCGQYMTALPNKPRYVMNLKLHHRQMHYRQSPFLNNFRMKTTTKVVKNMLPGHEKLKTYTSKSNLGGVSLVGLSL
jgi:hypothetical protein